MINAALPRFLKSAYRREPLPSCLITAGVVDAVIGGFDARWLLFAFGLGTVGVTLTLRWLIHQRRPFPVKEPVVQRYLPPSSSRPTLPVLSAAKKNPPH